MLWQDARVPALLGAVLAGVLLLASSAGPGLLAAAVVLLVAMLALGGVAPLPVAAARPSAGLALVCGVTAVVGTWAADAGDWHVTSPLVVATVATGIAFVALFVVQLLRRDGRAHVVASLSLGACGVDAAGLPAWWVAARVQPPGAAVVALGLAGAGVMLLVAGLPLPGPVPAWRSVAVAAGVGAGTALGSVGWPASVEAGRAAAVAGAAALAGLAAVAAVDRGVEEATVADAGAAEPPGARLAAWSLGATLPLCLAAPASYLVGRLLLG